MRSLGVAAASAAAMALAGTAGYNGAHDGRGPFPRLATSRDRFSSARPAPSHRLPAISPETLTAVVRNTCGLCHNDADKTGGLSLERFDVAGAAHDAETAEKMIRKLRAGMMPPPGDIKVGGDTAIVLAETLEKIVDRAAAANPNPGSRTFQRLNRAEYEQSIHDLLTLDVDAGKWLPLDTKSANFDNIADVQTPSATLLDSYLDAASEIARLAVGDATRAHDVDHVQVGAPRVAARPGRGRSGRHARRHVRHAHLSGRRRVRLRRFAPRDSDRAAVRLHGALRREGRDLGRRRTRGHDRRRPRHVAVRSARDGAGDQARSREGRRAPRQRRLHPHLRRSGQRQHRADRAQPRRHTDRLAVRNHRRRAPRRPDRARTEQDDRRIGDAEPEADLQLPPEDAEGRAALRAEDRRRSRRRGIPSPADG